MLFELTVGFVILVSSDEEEAFTAFISINTCLVVYILDGILLIVIEKDADLCVAIEQSRIIMRPAMDTAIDVNLIIGRMNMDIFIVRLYLNIVLPGHSDNLTEILVGHLHDEVATLGHSGRTDHHLIAGCFISSQLNGIADLV